ncbi:hypothetical protein PR048_016807 [Dryococelus australis]|uniref:Tc1-like transposase DDE domain-containing protein n=1 Tax=Dryococelus australis TaxID=614101 RepID=A0ABQ9H7T0_9NEOP|nr:hypothetical protein PR048_016807 [Dryococelus australis]
MDQRLDSLPRRARFDPPAGSLPDSRKWESCRTMPLVGGFSGGSPVSPALTLRRCSVITSFHPHRLSRPRCQEPPKYLNSVKRIWSCSLRRDQLHEHSISNVLRRVKSVPGQTGRSAADLTPTLCWATATSEQPCHPRCGIQKPPPHLGTSAHHRSSHYSTVPLDSRRVVTGHLDGFGLIEMHVGTRLWQVQEVKDPSCQQGAHPRGCGAALRCKGRGTGDPRENPPTSSIGRHDSHLRKSGGDTAENLTRFVLVGCEYSNRYNTLARPQLVVVFAWPPRSPDLNPIEHIWNAVESDLHALDPALINPSIVGGCVGKFGRLVTSRSSEPMRMIEVNMERCRTGGVGETGDPRENPPTTGIVGTKRPVTRPGIEPGFPWWEVSVLSAQPPWLRHYFGKQLWSAKDVKVQARGEWWGWGGWRGTNTCDARLPFLPEASGYRVPLTYLGGAPRGLRISIEMAPGRLMEACHYVAVNQRSPAPSPDPRASPASGRRQQLQQGGRPMASRVDALSSQPDIYVTHSDRAYTALYTRVHVRPELYSTRLNSELRFGRLLTARSSEPMRIPEKTRRPTASSGTIPTCQNPVTRPGIEPGFALVGGERANCSATTAPRGFIPSEEEVCELIVPTVNMLAPHHGDRGSITVWTTPESCRTMLLAGGFSRGSPVSPPLHSGAAPYLPQSPLSALKTSMLRAAKIQLKNLQAHRLVARI